jgi:hypothetical protein
MFRYLCLQQNGLFGEWFAWAVHPQDPGQPLQEYQPDPLGPGQGTLYRRVHLLIGFYLKTCYKV